MLVEDLHSHTPLTSVWTKETGKMSLVRAPQSVDEELVLLCVDAVQQKVEQLVVLLVRVVLRSRDVCALLVTQRSLAHQQIHQAVLALELRSQGRTILRQRNVEI